MNAALRLSYRFCGEVARREARNFYYSFLLMPPARRRSMCALYAFLRHSDDIADDDGTSTEKRAALDAWRFDLDRALDAHETPAWPGWPALADTVARRGIPRRHLVEVLDGVAMDIDPHPFATFADLYKYCYLVASAVGLSCLYIWGYRSENGRAEALAEACGVALQLTNILRDVREDAQKGRVYLPQEDLARFGVEPHELAAAMNDRVRELLAFEADRAQGYYAQVRPLARLVAPAGRPVLRTIVGIYRAILDEIARRDYDVLAGRVALPPWRKTAIALRSLAAVF